MHTVRERENGEWGKKGGGWGEGVYVCTCSVKERIAFCVPVSAHTAYFWLCSYVCFFSSKTR